MIQQKSGNIEGAVPLRPIMFVVVASIAFSLNDLVFKLLSGVYPLHEMMFFRATTALILIVIYMRWTSGGLDLLKTSRLKLHALRGGLMILANACQYAALAALPLADATAIYYAAPLLITVFSIFFLRERVGLWRWLAVSIGLIGVILIVRPGGAAYSGAAFLAVFAAAAYALSQIMTRRIGVTEQALTMSFYGQVSLNLFAILVGLAIGNGRFSGTGNAAADFLLRGWTWPTPFDLFLFITLGVISAVGGIMLTKAYRDGPPSLIASFEYLALPMSVIWGAVFWQSLPDKLSFIGILLVVFAGLSIAFREAKLGRGVTSRWNRLGR